MFQIALLALTAAAGAENVTPATAEDYIFTVPVHTNHIRGIVMGWPPAYRAIRSEDIDWLREAWAERYSLYAGRLVQHAGVGGDVAREDVELIDSFWNGWPRNDDAGYLDPDAPLLDGVRLCNMSLVETNVWTSTCYTNGVTNSYSTIVLEMTNGTTSVYTNSWSSRKLYACQEVLTNVHAYTRLDWCQPDGAGVFPGLTNTPRYGWASINIPYPTVSAVSNAYGILAKTSRLADVDVDCTNAGVHVSRSYYTGGAEATSTNASGSIYYTLYGGSEDGDYSWASESQTLQFTGIIPTRFTSSLCTTGGASRISIAAVYAEGSFYYHASTDDTSTASLATNYMASISGGALDVSGETAYVAVPVDVKSLCSAVAGTAGVPTVPDEGVKFESEAGAYQAWSCDVDKFVIIYTVTPSVALSTW